MCKFHPFGMTSSRTTKKAVYVWSTLGAYIMNWFIYAEICGDDDSWHDRFLGVIIINDEWMTGSNHVVANFLCALDIARKCMDYATCSCWLDSGREEWKKSRDKERKGFFSWIFYVNIFLALY